MSDYRVIIGKNMENLNDNINDFLKKNPKYKPYSKIYKDTPECEPVRYQSFVKYGKTNKYYIVKGKTMEELNRNIELFSQNNRGYYPYSDVLYTDDNCKQTRYQSFVRYKKSKSYRKRKSNNNNKSKQINKQKTYKRKKNDTNNI